VFVPQATDVNEPQVPEKSCIRGLAGDAERVIVVFAPTATKLYQTSFLLATPHPIDEREVYDAPTNVPAVFEHAAFDVNEMAPAHSSFAGGVCVIQILKLATPPAPDGLLLRFATQT